MKKIIYSDEKNVQKIISKINEKWKNDVYVLADFDRTLTYSIIDWEKKPSLISVIRNNPKYLWKEYSKKANELFDFYHPIEIDHSLSIEEKSKEMTKWWQAHLDLLVKSRLNINHIDEIVNSWIIKLRYWVIKFLNFLDKNNIPLIILSANWLWWDSIIDYLKYNDLYTKNIEIVSNKFEFDEKWYATWYKKNVIHVFNKWKIAFDDFPEAKEKIENKKNIILLWDSLWDPHMADWAIYENLLKIWFYNENNNKNINHFLEKYDVLLTGDSDGEFLNNILT